MPGRGDPSGDDAEQDQQQNGLRAGHGSHGLELVAGKFLRVDSLFELWRMEVVQQPRHESECAEAREAEKMSQTVVLAKPANASGSESVWLKAINVIDKNTMTPMGAGLTTRAMIVEHTGQGRFRRRCGAGAGSSSHVAGAAAVGLSWFVGCCLGMGRRLWGNAGFSP
jgi:hypothetical protein